MIHPYSPQAAQVTLQIVEAHGQHFTSGQLNGTALPVATIDRTSQIDTSQPLSLNAGWNELVIRETNIWGAGSFGTSLVADPAILWKLKISGPAPLPPAVQP